jgi:hypothetical protein
MKHFVSEWTSALADFKDAAHDAGVDPELTDTWCIKHDGTDYVFGRYDENGVFQVAVMLTSPRDLRQLAYLYA